MDYANAKAQERLQQLATILDDERRRSIRDIASQRQLFTTSLYSLVNTAAADLHKVISAALQQLDQSLQDALDKLDGTLRANVGSIGVMLSSFGGLLFALTLFVIFALQKIVRRIRIKMADLIRGCVFVLLVPFGAGLSAHYYNKYRESELVEVWEQQIKTSLANWHVAKAAAIAKRINSQWPNSDHDYSERKLAVLKDFLLEEQIWDSGTLRSRAADVQAAHLLSFKRIDADVMIILAYLESKANDALLMNDVIQKFLGGALSEPTTGKIGLYENELRMLGCDLYRTIEVANTRTNAHVRLTKWIDALGNKPQEYGQYISVAAKNFGVSKEYAEEVLSRERPVVPNCSFFNEDFRIDQSRLSEGTTARDVSSLREIAVLQHTLQVRRQVLLLDAAAGLWFSQCLFSGTFEKCPSTGLDGIPDELEKRYAWLNGVVHSYFSRGVALTPPARVIATLQFLKWLSKHRFITGSEFSAPWARWYDRNWKPLTLPAFLFEDPSAGPVTLCYHYYPPPESFAPELRCKDYKVSPKISLALLDEIDADSYLSRLIDANIRGFSDARTTGVISGLYELSYRKALADIVLAFNDAVDLKLAGISNPNNAIKPQERALGIKGEEALVTLKPDSPMWELVVCEPRAVDNDKSCEGSTSFKGIFEILNTIGNRDEQTTPPSEIVMQKLNTVFAF